MTPDQFIFWLQGYLAAQEGNSSMDIIRRKLEELNNFPKSLLQEKKQKIADPLPYKTPPVYPVNPNYPGDWMNPLITD